MSYNRWMPAKYNSELYHHGVKGMKWGVRHEKESIGGRNKPKGDRDHYEKYYDTDTAAGVAADLAKRVSVGQFKTAAAEAAALASGAAAAVKIKANEVRTSKLETDPATGLKLKDPNKTYTPEQDMKAVNPGFLNQMSNGARNNCMLCTLTFDLRRRGYDVTANWATNGYTFDDLSYWYPGCSTSQQNLNLYPAEGGGYYYTEEDMEEYIDKSIEDLVATGEGARGAFCVFWNSGGGHAMAYEIKDGKPIIYDCQTGRVEDVREILKQTHESHATRLDNVEPNAEYIKEVTHDDHSKKGR